MCISEAGTILRWFSGAYLMRSFGHEKQIEPMKKFLRRRKSHSFRKVNVQPTHESVRWQWAIIYQQTFRKVQAILVNPVIFRKCKGANGAHVEYQVLTPLSVKLLYHVPETDPRLSDKYSASNFSDEKLSKKSAQSPCWFCCFPDRLCTTQMGTFVWSAVPLGVTGAQMTVFFTVVMLFCITNFPNLTRKVVQTEQILSNLNCNNGWLPVVIDSTMHELPALLATSTARFSKVFLLLPLSCSFLSSMSPFSISLKTDEFHGALSSQIASDKEPFFDKSRVSTEARWDGLTTRFRNAVPGNCSFLNHDYAFAYDYKLQL
jgi:hypothetical protein